MSSPLIIAQTDAPSVSALLTLVQAPDGAMGGVSSKDRDVPSPKTFCQAVLEQITWVREQMESGKEFGMAASWAKGEPTQAVSGGPRAMRMIAAQRGTVIHM